MTLTEADRHGVAFVIGPSGIGKSTILNLLPDLFRKEIQVLSLDTITLHEGKALGLVSSNSAYDLLKAIGKDAFFILGLTALFRRIGEHKSETPLVVDVGAAFQNLGLLSELSNFYPMICIDAENDAAFDRFKKFRSTSRSFEKYNSIEYSDVRKKVYSSAWKRLDTTNLDVRECATRLAELLLVPLGWDKSSLTSFQDSVGCPELTKKKVSQMEYLDFEKYERNAQENPGEHWKNYKVRWNYYSRAVEVAKTLDISDPSDVLEMGTMGACVVDNCDTIDYAVNWDFEGKAPTYLHDAREIPWPIKDKQYKLFIALRVFQHLAPMQEKCFHEAKRIAENVIIVTPDSYNKDSGINLDDFTKWNNGKPPKIAELASGKSNYLYFWDADAFSG